jgi:hypothetical protein
MAEKRDRPHSRRADEPRDPYAGEGVRPPSDSVGEALARARHHGRSAASESLAALQALVEATSLATRGRGSDSSRLLGPMAKLFAGLIDDLGRDGGAGAARILDTIALAVDGEIARWQERAVDDVEARTVLRAFLGLREVLWELGVRRNAGGRRAPRAKPRRSGPRVQRVPVQG